MNEYDMRKIQQTVRNIPDKKRNKQKDYLLHLILKKKNKKTIGFTNQFLQDLFRFDQDQMYQLNLQYQLQRFLR